MTAKLTLSCLANIRTDSIYSQWESSRRVWVSQKTHKKIQKEKKENCFCLDFSEPFRRQRQVSRDRPKSCAAQINFLLGVYLQKDNLGPQDMIKILIRPRQRPLPSQLCPLTAVRFCTCCSAAQSWLTLCDPVDCSTPGSPVLHYLLQFAQTPVHWVGDPSSHLMLCCPLLPLLSVFPSIKVVSNESVLRIRWPKYWSFSFSISPPNEHSGLISFRIDWFALLAV